MHSLSLSAVLFSVSLASGVLASNIVVPRALLQVRQGGDAFVPGTKQGTGNTCAEAFGPNSKLCADSGTCFDSSLGDSCCSEGYPCGSGSFCLVKGYCCPDEDTPEQCAAANGITLPANFAKSTSAAGPVATTPVVTSATKVASTSVSIAIPTTSAAPFPIPGKSTTVAASGTASATGAPRTSSTLTPFQGAASSTKIAGSGFVLALVGVFGALL